MNARLASSVNDRRLRATKLRNLRLCLWLQLSRGLAVSPKSLAYGYGSQGLAVSPNSLAYGYGSQGLLAVSPRITRFTVTIVEGFLR
jgi:hypothetical protein